MCVGVLYWLVFFFVFFESVYSLLGYLFDKSLGRNFVFLEQFLEHKGGMVELPICLLQASEMHNNKCEYRIYCVYSI